jgi:hypothetical protein
MSVIETIVNDNLKRIHNKRILEILCKDGLISLEASKYGQYVLATDIDVMQVSQLERPDHMKIKQLNPLNLYKLMESFETIICFNAMQKIGEDLNDFIDLLVEFQGEAVVLFIQTKPIEKVICYDVLLPLLDSKGIRYNINENSVYQSITIH